MLKKRPKILGLIEKHSTTYVVWKNTNGKISHQSIDKLTKNKTLVARFSKKDAFLLGYLLGAHHEKNHPTSHDMV